MAALSERPAVQAIMLELPGAGRLRLSDACTTEILIEEDGVHLQKRVLVDSGSAISIIDAGVLGQLPVSVLLNTSDNPVCSTANKSALPTLGSVNLTFKIGSKPLSGRFYVAAAPLVTSVIIGRDIMATSGMNVYFEDPKSNHSTAVLSRHDEEDWRALPEGWEAEEVVYNTNKLHIVSARRDGPVQEGEPTHRFYVGVNPSLVKEPSRAEQLGALIAHKKLIEATSEAQEASSKCFERWLRESRLQPTALTKSSSTTSWYIVGGDNRRYRPVFSFIHLNRNLRAAFGKEPFSQALISNLIEKSRCYRYVTINDVEDAYMHLWLLPSNRHLFTVNISPLDSCPRYFEFCCLPYGPSHCPRILEICLQWLLNKRKLSDDYEVESFMDDLVIFSHQPDTEAEKDLSELFKDYDLKFKPTKRQVLTEQDCRLLGLSYTHHGAYMVMPDDKLSTIKARSLSSECSYSGLLSCLGSLEELPVVPPWAVALKHFGQGLVSHERADKERKWSDPCSPELRELVNKWHELVVSLEPKAFAIPRLFNFRKPLHVYTDAAKYAGGYQLNQDGQTYLQRVHIFSEKECHLPIVCLEAHIFYRSMAAVHRLELVAKQRFDRVYYHVDNVAVEVTFRGGRPASSSSKDAKPILYKYLAMTHELFDPQDFGRRIFIERVTTELNPADSLTRHSLLNDYIKFARDNDDVYPSLDSFTPIEGDNENDMVRSSIVVIQEDGDGQEPIKLPTRSNIRAEQRSDQQLNGVRDHLERGKQPGKSISICYSLVWNTLLIRDDMLMKISSAVGAQKISDAVVVPVLPSSLIKQVLKYFHNPNGANHPGISRLIASIKSTYWFPKIHKHACDHVSACRPCQEQLLKASWTQRGVQRCAPPGPWHTVAADVLSVSYPRGHMTLLVTVCLFSYWPEVRVLQSKSSQEIALALRSINSRFGPMKILKTDRGLEFKGAVEKYLAEIEAVHSTTLPYSPVAVVEQLNKTILQKFQIAYNSPIWSRLPPTAILDEILWSLRTTPSSVTRLAPFVVMYGRHPHTRLVYDEEQRQKHIENIDNILNEKRAKAVLGRREPIKLKIGSKVYVKVRAQDRSTKVGIRWLRASVLKQDGSKVYLMIKSSQSGRAVPAKVIERHVRECVPIPEKIAGEKDYVEPSQAPPNDDFNSVDNNSKDIKKAYPYKVKVRLRQQPDQQDLMIEEPPADEDAALRTRYGRIIKKPNRLHF